MSSVLIHVAQESTYFRADIVDYAARTDDDGYECTARTIAHVRIDDLALTMTAEQAERMHAALGGALAKYRQAAATAAA